MSRENDYAAFTSHRWVQMAFDLALVCLGMFARIARRRAARRDARAGYHGNHTVCRHGRAVDLR